MNGKYISFSCITCKSQISQLKECNTVYCPQCNDIDIFENEVLSKSNKKDSSIDVSFFPSNIYESKIYSNLSDLLNNISLDEFDENDIEEFKGSFKNSKINYLCLDVKSFNELNTNIFKGSSVLVFFYVNVNINFKFVNISKIMSNLHKKIPNNIAMLMFHKPSKIDKIGIYYD